MNIRKTWLLQISVLISAIYTSHTSAQVGAPYQISGDMVTFGDVGVFQISADGQRVIYRADQDQDDVFELYSVSIAGGSAVKI